MAGTTKRAAAASDRRQNARRQRSPSAQRSSRPVSSSEPAAGPNGTHLPLIVSTVLPDEAEVDRRNEELRSGLLRRGQVDWARVPTCWVTLDIALADLRPDQRKIEVIGDPVAMADTVQHCLSYGWLALLELVNKVEAHGIGDLTELVYSEANAAVYEIIQQLAEIEELAREIILHRLQVSAEQVTAARLTYLSGPGVDRKPIGSLKATQQELSLRPGPHLDALRSMLEDLAPSEAMIAIERTSVRSQKKLVQGKPNLSDTLDESVLRLRAFEMRRAERVNKVAQYSPLASWLVGTKPNEKDLLPKILDELEIVTDSISSVRNAVLDGGVWATETVSGEQSKAGWKPARIAPGAAKTNPFTRNQPEPRGPWRFPLVIDAALQELGHLSPSPVAAAANAVTTGSDEYNGLSHVMSGVVTAVSVAAPPVGAALGIATGLWNLFHDYEDYKDQREAHRAVLDPGASLAVPPSIRQIEASIIGLVASAVDATRVGGLVSGLAFGVAETVIRVEPKPSAAP